MHRREISYASNRDFGVQVALINVVSFAGVKTATRGRRGSSGSCYNRRRINDLGSEAEGAKMSYYFHRYLLGANVKLVIPADPKCLVGACPDSGGPWVGTAPEQTC